MATSNSIIGNSKCIRDTLAKASRVARTPLSVLITGESGTGKELFARFIHDKSTRSGRPWVAINCAAIPAELLEVELFGCKKGAFSGATHDRDGLFVQAHGGTLFLDEIGDMPLPLQAKILRVLQEREVRPVGGKDVQKVDVRVVAATHRDLGEMAVQGKFREDLVYRLRGYALHLPPLRERGNDVIILARAILASQPEFSTRLLGHDARELLLSHPWPGNVRELRNALLAAAVDASRIIGAVHLHPHLMGRKPDITTAPALPLDARLLEELAGGWQISIPQLRRRVHAPKSTLYRHMHHLAEQGKIQRIANDENGRFSVRATEPVPESALSDRQTQAIRLARESGRLTRQQFADTTGISLRTASRELAAMVDLGLLTSDGQGGRMSGYILCPA